MIVLDRIGSLIWMNENEKMNKEYKVNVNKMAMKTIVVIPQPQRKPIWNNREVTGD